MIDSIKDPNNEEAKKQMCAASAFAGVFLSQFIRLPESK